MVFRCRWNLPLHYLLLLHLHAVYALLRAPFRNTVNVCHNIKNAYLIVLVLKMIVFYLLGILKVFQQENGRSSDDTEHEDEEGNSDAVHIHTVERVQILTFRRFRAPSL